MTRSADQKNHRYDVNNMPISRCLSQKMIMSLSIWNGRFAKNVVVNPWGGEPQEISH